MNRSPITILVVEDDPTAMSLLAGILKQEGLIPVCAASIHDAHLVAQAERFSLAILDVTLPDGNGLELCRWMKKDSIDPDIPVFILSADTDVQTKVAGFEAGAVDYITKPFHRAEVIARVKTHLRLHESFQSVVELQSLKLAQLGQAQQMMLPQPEANPQAKFALYYKPLQEAGGDFCQVFNLGPNLYDYVVADVCGHDVGTAMTTAVLHALFKQNSSPLYSPKEILNTINRVAMSLISNGQYITVCYGRINRKTNRLCLVNAGHPPAVLLRCDGTVSILSEDGDIVGAFESPSYGVIETVVRPGDRLFLISDAVVENGEKTNWQKGIQILEKECKSLGQTNLKDAVDQIANLAIKDGLSLDDITVMGIEV